KGDIRLISAKLTEDTDTSLVFDTDRMNNAFPLKMYSFRTDSAGSISAVSDIKESAYGAYDMGDIKPELEYDGMVLKYNGMDYDLTMYGPAANAIMDVQQVGEWILIEGHVNPHVSFYYLLNIYTGNIEKTIEGANLTWMDDDLTTTVYSAYDAVYDFKGSIIGRTDGGEVCELKFAENGSKVKAEDFDGNKFSFDAPEKDAATYRYMSYLRYPSVENWNAFIDQASDGDVAFAIVNPPMDMVNLLPVQYPDVNKDDSLTGTGTNAGNGTDAGTGTDAGSNSDAGNSSGTGTGEDLGTGTGIGNDYEEYPEGFYIVALENDTVLRVDSGEPSFSEEGNGFLWNSSSTLDTSKMKKGSVRGYRSVVPEGIPDKCVFISSKGREGMFMVTPISGESNRCGEFIPTK
ncbi:MAG: hypothetical protein K6E33_02935, partial [Lachnospiraceae bacterium]|nr:hypothetical protein [Lachnospiraceae bacterium]